MRLKCQEIACSIQFVDQQEVCHVADCCNSITTYSLLEAHERLEKTADRENYQMILDKKYLNLM